MGVGLVALLFPFCFYIRGAFGDGDLRHQDTVFKFGLQAWLLLGTGVAAEVGFRASAWWKEQKVPVRAIAAPVAALFGLVLALAPLCVAWTRAVRDAPTDESGKHILSLNAARYLPEDEQKGIEWLRQNARPGETVLEAVGRNDDGSVGGDYNASFGRVAAFSGVPSYLGWPQHVSVWGAPWDEVLARAETVGAVYQGADDAGVLAALQKSGTTYVFLGNSEWMQGAGAQRLSRGVGKWQSAQRFGENQFSAQILRFER
jgi:uncharacterized membrane protein